MLDDDGCQRDNAPQRAATKFSRDRSLNRMIIFLSLLALASLAVAQETKGPACMGAFVRVRVRVCACVCCRAQLVIAFCVPTTTTTAVCGEKPCATATDKTACAKDCFTKAQACLVEKQMAFNAKLMTAADALRAKFEMDRVSVRSFARSLVASFVRPLLLKRANATRCDRWTPCRA